MSDVDERDLLVQELRQRAGEVSGQPVTFHEVRDRARRMQRRRTVVTGAVAAAVAAVALPTGVAVTTALDGNGSGNGPGYAASPSADPTTGPSADATGRAPTPNPDGTFPLTITGLPRGGDPEVSYVVGGERLLVTPSGETDLPVSYSQITPYRDGWLALRGGEDGWENVVLDQDLGVQRTTPGGPTLVPSPDGRRILYSQRDFNVPGRTVVIDEPSETDYEREAMTWDAPRASTVVPVGYLDEDTVVFQTEGGEQPLVAMGTGEDGATVPLEGFVKVTSVSQANGLVAGQVSYDPVDGSCYGVMDPAVSTTRMLWTTCDFALFEFSPDGRHVIAGPADFDMWGPSGLTVLDVATWAPVVEFEPARGVVGQVAQATWEDDDSVVAVVVENDEFAVVRAELSGALEAVSDSYRSTDLTLPLWFAERPRY